MCDNAGLGMCSGLFRYSTVKKTPFFFCMLTDFCTPDPWGSRTNDAETAAGCPTAQCRSEYLDPFFHPLLEQPAQLRKTVYF